MTIPAVINIDDVPYVVVVVPSDGSVKADPNEDGGYEARTQTIEIRAGLPAHYERNTLLHEVLHACWEHGGLNVHDRPAPTEEEAVSSLAYRLIQVLRANPALVAYLVAP